MLRTTASKAKLDRVKSEELPEALRLELSSFSQRLTQNYAAFFTSHPRAKHFLARLFKAQLPPLSRPRGPAGYKEVTEAIRRRDELRRRYPRKSPKKIWRMVYSAAIPAYDRLPRLERRVRANELRQRVLWRLKARRRRQQRTDRDVDVPNAGETIKQISSCL